MVVTLIHLILNLNFSVQCLTKILSVIRHEKPEELYRSTPGLRHIWIGHASYFVEMNNFRFLVDSIFRSRRSAFDLNKSLWGSFAVWDATHKFYFAEDTGYTHNISIFRHIGKTYGPFDLSAIPIGAYEPRWMMEAQHMSPDEAVQIHIDVQSKKSIGIHWGTWALANEYFMEPPKKLAQAVLSKLLNSSSFIVVKHSEVFDLP
ncbi:unnamed protein product [Rotaria sp. Silwood2]|nr:unnamed protein product [Rotaria sp. Silwood2]